MAQDKSTFPNIDNSNLAAYPDGQIKDNTGSGDGTPISQLTNSDIQEFFSKLMRLAGIEPNGGFDNEVNGFQFVNAARALAGKNDIVRTITSVTGSLHIDTPIGTGRLEQSEVLIASPVADYGDETNIIGSDTATLPITLPAKPYKATDLLMMVCTPSAIQVYVLATSGSLNRMVAEFGYLLATDNDMEFAGTATNKATTPASNKAAFKRRVNGDDSSDYLAIAGTRDGLLSKTDKAKIDAFAVKNRGFITGVDPGGAATGYNYPTSGSSFDIISAVAQSGGGVAESIIQIKLKNPMIGNWFVRHHLQSDGNINADNDCLVPVFHKISDTVYNLSISESAATTVAQNLTIYIEAVQL